MVEIQMIPLYCVETNDTSIETLPETPLEVEHGSHQGGNLVFGCAACAQPGL